MKIWTFGEGLDKISLDMDLTNETFITPDEMVGIWNDAIQIASSQIHKLGVEDEYFRTQAPISLVAGTARYAMPTNIFANKIRGVVYENGIDIYPVTKVRRRNMFSVMAEINQNDSSAQYQYDIENPSVATGIQMVLVPPSRETSASVLTVHFIREALYIPLVSAGSLAASRATKIDLPEFMTFIFAFVKWRIAFKIPHPNLVEFKEDHDRQLALMVDTLTEMVVDDATEIEPDTSHYERHS